MNEKAERQAWESFNSYKSDNPDFKDWYFNHLKRLIGREEAKKIWITKYQYKVQEPESESLKSFRFRITTNRAAIKAMAKQISIGIVITVLGGLILYWILL